MPWYRTGTVAITAGQTTVTGTGTAFALNARVGDAFQGPDGRWYEVTNIASATVLSILPAYQGATVSGGAYGLAPMQGYVKESADRLRQLVDQLGATFALFGGATNIETLRQNILAATRGANSDITSLSGLTTALSVAQGGTGAQTKEGARQALGLGAVAVEDILPIEKGGTGGKTQAAARTGLGLGAAAVAAILGTVSQSGGVPTGAIIERGSNTNGEYVKYADGTMVCWFTSATLSTTSAAVGSVFLGDPVVFTFPATFISAPVVISTGARSTGSIAHWAQLRATPSVSAASLGLITATSGATGYVSAIAIGRWY